MDPAVSLQPAVSSLRFCKPADNHRPYHSHRFEVWSPKLRRRITFFRELSLEMWALLEADSGVLAFCERPIVVKGEKRNIVVDFWVQRTNREEILVLPRTTKRQYETPTNTDAIDPALKAWGKSHSMNIREITLAEIRAEPNLTANWKTILHYLAANITLLPPDLCAGIRNLFSVTKEMTIEIIEQRCSGEDPILVRTAVFSLLQQGVVRSDDLRSKVLTPSTRFTTV